MAQHLHFAGPAPGYSLPLGPPPYSLGPSGLVKFSVLLCPNPCDFFQDCDSKCHPTAQSLTHCAADVDCPKLCGWEEEGRGGQPRGGARKERKFRERLSGLASSKVPWWGHQETAP